MAEDERKILESKGISCIWQGTNRYSHKVEVTGSNPVAPIGLKANFKNSSRYVVLIKNACGNLNVLPLYRSETFRGPNGSVE